MVFSCVVKLIWVYLYRCPEAATATLKRLDGIFRNFFPPGRKHINPPDLPPEPLIELVFIAGVCQTDFTVRSIILGLLLNEAAPLILEQIAPERVVIAIKSYLQICEALMAGEIRPAFPVDSVNPSFCHTPAVKATPKCFLLTPALLKKFSLESHSDKLGNYLGKLIPLLDTAFGHNLKTDDKYGHRMSLSASHGASGLAGYMEMTGRERPLHHDIIQTWLQAIPSVMPSAISMDKLLDIMIRYTIHVDAEISTASNGALKRLAEHMPEVGNELTRSFGNFLINLPEKWEAVIESGLKLYTELLHIVKAEQTSFGTSQNLKSTQPGSGSNVASSLSLADKTANYNVSQELEKYGTFFLLSVSAGIRQQGLGLLELAASLNVDEKTRLSEAPALGSSQRYLIEILDQGSAELLRQHYNETDERLPPPMTDSHRKNANVENTLEKVTTFPATLRSMIADENISEWTKIVPRVLKLFFEQKHEVMSSTWTIVNTRLVQCHPSIVYASDPARHQPSTLSSKFTSKTYSAASEEMIEQWKLYVIFGCTCSTIIDDVSTKKPKAKGADVSNSTTSAELFRMLCNFLTAESKSIRAGAVAALANTHWLLQRVLLEELTPLINQVTDDLKLRGRNNQRKNKKMDRLRIEIAHVLCTLAEMLQHPEYFQVEEIRAIFYNYTRETGMFLSEPDIQYEVEHQLLRFYFCEFVQSLQCRVAAIAEPSMGLPFDVRTSLFRLFEEWCGYGSVGNETRERDAKLLLSLTDQVKDLRERSVIASAMEEQRKLLEKASISAMAALCKGPVVARDKKKGVISFDVPALFQWLDAVFASDNESDSGIAQIALENLLYYNQDQPAMLEDVLIQCYTGKPTEKITQGYFSALCETIAKLDYPCSQAAIINLILYKCGDPSQAIRRRVVEILDAYEARHWHTNRSADLKCLLMSVIPASYRHAQFLLSTALAEDHAHMSQDFFLELVLRLEQIYESRQIDLLRYVVPWIKYLNIVPSSVRPGDTEKPFTLDILLDNLFYLTVRFGDDYNFKIAAIWQELALKEENLEILIKTLIRLAAKKRNPIAVTLGRKIITYMGRTGAASKIVEIVMSEINPKAMIPEGTVHGGNQTGLETGTGTAKDVPIELDIAEQMGPFRPRLHELIADLPKRPAYSRGQLAGLFLTDAATEMKELKMHLPTLLHLSFIQLDHFNINICDQNRLLLMHLIHAIVLRNSDSKQISTQKAIALVEELSHKDGKPLWPHNDVDVHLGVSQTPDTMVNMIKQLLDIFDKSTELAQDWGETALRWSTACPVRHLACRSLQMFRILMPVFTPRMLADLLSRLGTTIADPNPEVQGYALESLITLNGMIASLDKNKMILFPQMFWALVGSLNTTLPNEFAQSVQGLQAIVNFLDFGSSSVAEVLIVNRPAFAERRFDGVQPFIIRGMSSSKTAMATLKLVNHLALVKDDTLIDLKNKRWLFTMLVNFPRMLDALDSENSELIKDCQSIANDWSQVLETRHSVFAKLFDSYAKSKFRAKDDFVKQFTTMVAETFSAEIQITGIVFLVSTLQNPMFASKTLKLLKHLLPNITKKEVMLEVNSDDLVKPILSLAGSDLMSDALEVIDGTMVLSDGQSDAEFLKSLLSTKSIDIIALDLQSPRANEMKSTWVITEEITKACRTNISQVVGTFVGLMGSQLSLGSGSPSFSSLQRLVGMAGKGQSGLQLSIPDPNTSGDSQLLTGTDHDTWTDDAEEIAKQGGFVSDPGNKDLVSALQDLDEYFREEGAVPSHNTIVRDRNKRLTLVGLKMPHQPFTQSNSSNNNITVLHRVPSNTQVSHQLPPKPQSVQELVKQSNQSLIANASRTDVLSIPELNMKSMSLRDEDAALSRPTSEANSLNSLAISMTYLPYDDIMTVETNVQHLDNASSIVDAGEDDSGSSLDDYPDEENPEKSKESKDWDPNELPSDYKDPADLLPKLTDIPAISFTSAASSRPILSSDLLDMVEDWKICAEDCLAIDGESDPAVHTVEELELFFRPAIMIHKGFAVVITDLTEVLKLHLVALSKIDKSHDGRKRIVAFLQNLRIFLAHPYHNLIGNLEGQKSMKDVVTDMEDYTQVKL